MRVRVKVNPGSKTEGVRLLEPDFYQVRTRAPAESGRANRRVVELMAVCLGVDPRRLQIVAGASKPLKVIDVADDPATGNGS